MPVPILTDRYGHAVHQPAGEPVQRPAPDPDRVTGLDGLRGLAALFVVVHHCWLLSFRGRYPLVDGPDWLGWLLHGRFAVVFFITLSGFSLAIAPARHGWRLGGVRRYAQRRAWRILPPYWAALVFSLFVAYMWTRMPLADPPTARAVVVYGLLLQDFVPAPVPNAVFWSIAVEAALYLAFPLLLIVRRWAGAAVMLAAVVVPVVVVGLLVPAVSVTPTTPATAASPMQTWFTFELAPLFAMGVVAAGVVAAGERVRRLPWHWLALLAAAPVLLLIVVQGSVWTVAHYYWIDLALGPAIALLLAAVATRRPAPLTWLLATRPVSRLGRYSYSLYLIHLPIVLVINRKLVAPHVPPGLPRFWVTLVLATSASLVAAWVFASIFEIPFQRYRSWAALRSAASDAVSGGRQRRSWRLPPLWRGQPTKISDPGPLRYAAGAGESPRGRGCANDG
jgi:peptidoglycan/LPS O-acetylase OafA/YrhL